MSKKIRYCEGCGIVGWRGFKCNCSPQEIEIMLKQSEVKQ
jgi:hypothetical protein